MFWSRQLLYSSKRHAVCSFCYIYCLSLIYTFSNTHCAWYSTFLPPGLTGEIRSSYARHSKQIHTHASSIGILLISLRAFRAPTQDVGYHQYPNARPVRGNSKFHSPRRPSDRLGQSSEWRSRPSNAARDQCDFGVERFLLVLCMLFFTQVITSSN